MKYYAPLFPRSSIKQVFEFTSDYTKYRQCYPYISHIWTPYSKSLFDSWCDGTTFKVIEVVPLINALYGLDL